MSKTLRLDIVTPEKVAFSGEGRMVVARGIDGELGILPRHAPLITPLQVFPVRLVREDADEIIIACCGGFMEVQNNVVTIITQCAEMPEEIDIARAEAAKARAEQRLHDGKKENINIARAEAALRRAMMRLKVAKHSKQ